VPLSADFAKPLVPMEGLVGFPVALAQHFNLLHFLIVFFQAGKEIKQSRFEQVIRMGRL
jgi:hypothetical protein